MKKFEAGLGRFVISYRIPLILLSLLFVAGAGYGTRFLAFSSNNRMFFSEDNPELQAFNALEQTYTKFENVFFTLAPKSKNVFSRDVLTAVQDLTERAWKLPYSSRVDSLTNYQHTKVKGDDLIVEDLVGDAAQLADEQLIEIRHIALNDPLLKRRLISPSGHVTGVNVNVVKPDEDGKASDRIAAAAYALQAEMEQKYPQLDIYVTGVVMIDRTFELAAEEDIKLLVPIMCGLLLFILALCLRSVMGMGLTFLVIVFSTLSGVGLAGWLGIPMNPASANAPTIILTLAVADSVHILTTIFHLMQKGLNRHQAIEQSLQINFQPVMVTSLTTAIGFLTMNFSDAPPFRDLGNVVAMGVVFAFLYSIFLLPALVAVLPLKVARQSSRSSVHIYERLADMIVRKRTLVLWTMILVTLGIASGIPRIQLDDDFVKFFSTRFDFRRATDFTAENLTGMYMIDWDLRSGREGGINEPEYQQTVEDFANWFRQQQFVCHVYTFTDIMKQINRNMHEDDSSYYRLPQERELSAQYLFLYEMNLPFGLDLNDRINVDKSASRMTVSLVGASTKEMRELEEAGRAWLKKNAPPSMYTHGSGVTMMYSHLSERNIKSMLSSSLIALSLISVIMIFVLRSVKLGLLSLLPNIAPAFMGFGIWGYAVGQVGLAVSVLIAMTMGIVVDDTVHFLAKYQRGRKEQGMSAEEAVRFAFRTVAAPMWISTATLVSGFIVLACSGFQINAHMGSMTAITISFALLLDFFFLPVLLLRFDGSTPSVSASIDAPSSPSHAGEET
ncbi:MAG: MMPL family transporter [Candidatus Electrothrix aestuarii]|uniref:MMPL family transporter n=1 Tax=Candidatus Electrothrix aestuarii TaxID=3062594 RepID=A0AAU8LPP9_9BACT|nr:MMPL family transporter [Candidatus Electrothrix aestuarii]